MIALLIPDPRHLVRAASPSSAASSSSPGSRWLRTSSEQLEAQSRRPPRKAAQYAAHTERLEQRVRVLERIVTDKGIDLADEIERLRDDRVN